jgi:hypothetical protein
LRAQLGIVGREEAVHQLPRLAALFAAAVDVQGLARFQAHRRRAVAVFGHRDQHLEQALLVLVRQRLEVGVRKQRGGADRHLVALGVEQRHEQGLEPGHVRIGALQAQAREQELRPFAQRRPGEHRIDGRVESLLVQAALELAQRARLSPQLLGRRDRGSLDLLGEQRGEIGSVLRRADGDRAASSERNQAGQSDSQYECVEARHKRCPNRMRIGDSHRRGGAARGAKVGHNV